MTKKSVLVFVYRFMGISGISIKNKPETSFQTMNASKATSNDFKQIQTN